MQINLDGVSSAYSRTGTVLSKISLQISKGEFIGIAGKAGCGKTTLLETIAGLHKPESGHVYFEGSDVYGKQFDHLSFRRKLQIVFQFPENQFFETDVDSEIAFGLKSLKISEKDMETRITSSLAAVGLNDSSIRRVSPFALSGGQKRRLALACALVVNPEILLLDEPFSGLDAEGEKQMIHTLAKINAGGTTVIMVSHDPNILCEVSMRIIVLRNGEIALDGPPQTIYQNKDLCDQCGIGQPDTKKTADMVGFKDLPDYKYKTFIDTLTEKILGGRK